jgi:ABC-type amino acid transport substrate-binding protein
VGGGVAEWGNVVGGEAWLLNVDGGGAQWLNVEGGEAQLLNVGDGEAQWLNVDGGEAQLLNLDGGEAQLLNVDGGEAQWLNVKRFALPINAECHFVSEKRTGFCLLYMPQTYQISRYFYPYYGSINMKAVKSSNILSLLHVIIEIL